MQRLFRAFSQADDSTTRKYGGTGLGLAICKQLIELMGGEISVKSTPGMGATFMFKLPTITSHLLESDQPAQFTGLSGLKVLIVEDNPINREILAEYTQSWGMLVDAVPSALAALDLLRKPSDNQPPYDLVVIDMKMPGMNGLELGRLVKADTKIAHIPTVMLTSTLFQGEASQANANGFSAYLIKPINKTELYNCLLKALNSGTDLLTNGKSEAPKVPPDKLHKIRILLAEDNPVNQEVAQHMLQGFGCTVDLANNGLETLAAVEKTPYDLVFMDCMMPEMDGYQATAEIRRRQNTGQLAHFPIIALTANAIEGDREKCLIAGMDDYLSKPFKLESLMRAIQSWIKIELAITSDGSKPKNLPDLIPKTPSSLHIQTLETIRNLDHTGNDKFVHDIITLYLSNAVDLLQSLEAAWSEGKVESIQAVSHTLKSSSNQIGALNLGELCRKVENEARNNRYDISGQALEQIKHEFANAQLALDNYL